MKRITSLLLAIVLFAGLVLTGAPVAHAASDMSVSDELVEVLKKEEGFSSKPYWDYSQYTIGYGTRCPSDMVDYYKENGISKAAAETLLRNYLSSTERAINTKLIDKYDLELTQGQFDALISFTYNLGTGWLSDTDTKIHTAIRKGTTGSDLINAFTLWCNAGGSILPGLVRRRLCEANIYLNGEYSNTRADNFCYVYYNANGGSVSYKIQGYDSNEGVAPAYTPTYSGHTFMGWYTAKTGGTKITKLTKGLNGDTLYARWDDEGQADDDSTAANGVEITVTASGVNLRKGPGTNYSIVGMADKGDTFTVTETDQCDTYTWGKIGSSKWIALKYTDYDEAVKDQQPEPTTPTETTESTEETTESTETTAPAETTKPAEETTEATEETTETTEETTESTEETTESTEETTESTEETTESTEETTEATEETTEATEETTKPTEETTEPTQTVDKTKVTGKVKASKLAVRSGPGSNYKVVKHITKGTKVTITERRTIDGIVWGKISSGWISVRHVTLDEPEAETTKPTESTEETVDKTKVTGKVKASKLAVRSGPGSDYKVVKHITEGTKVTITERRTINGIVWGKISSGWISVRHVTLDEPEAETTKPTESTEETVDKTKVTGKVKASKLAVRSGPGSDYKVVKHITEGTKVTITERRTIDGIVWGKISSGWISVRHVTLDETTVETVPPETEESTQTTNLTGKVNAKSGLSVRKGAGTSYAVKKYLSYGTEVTITEIKDVKGTEWGKISSGWICLDYVTMDNKKTEEQTTKTVTASCLNVRASASTSAKIVDYYYKDAKITIEQTKTVDGTTWGKTSKGWVSMDYVK